MMKKVAVMALGLLASSLSFASPHDPVGPINFRLPQIACTTTDPTVCDQEQNHFVGLVYRMGSDSAAYLFRGLQRVTLTGGRTQVSTEGSRVALPADATVSDAYNVLESARLIRKIRSTYQESVSVRCDVGQFECLQVLQRLDQFGASLSTASSCSDRARGEFGCEGLQRVKIVIGNSSSSIQAQHGYQRVSAAGWGNIQTRHNSFYGSEPTEEYDLTVTLNQAITREEISRVFSQLSDNL